MVFIEDKEKAGEWSSEVLEEGLKGFVACVQALADGRIVSGDSKGTLCIWDGEVVV